MTTSNTPFDFNGGKMLHLFNYSFSGEGKRRRPVGYVQEFNNTDFKPTYPAEEASVLAKLQEELEALKDDELISSLDLVERIVAAKVAFLMAKGTADALLAADSAKRAEDALLHGTVYVKIDGSNHRLVCEEGVWSIFARFDDRKRKLDDEKLPEDTITLGPGNVSKLAGHKYFFVRKPRGMPGKIGKMYDAMYAVVDQNLDYLATLSYTEISFEAIGKKFNRTPRVKVDAAIAIHRDQEYTDPFELTFNGLQSLLLDQICVEGVVIEHKGVFWKVRSDMFDRKYAAGRQQMLPVILGSK